MASVEGARCWNPSLTNVPFMFSIAHMRTRGDLLRFAVAFALMKARKIVRGLRQGLTEDERFAVADAVVGRLKEHGDPWKLSEDLPAQNNASVAQSWMPGEEPKG
jgi:hypothetical protein